MTVFIRRRKGYGTMGIDLSRIKIAIMVRIGKRIQLVHRFLIGR